MLLDDLNPLLPELAARAAAQPDAYPAQDVDVLGRFGAFGAPFPKELGGRASSLVDMVRAVEAIASAAPSTALLASMPMGLAGVIASPEGVPSEHRAEWDAQVERIAGEYRAGKLFAACNSEKGAGGSLAATKTVARAGEGGTLVLEGEKILASFGTSADVFFSTAKVTGDGDAAKDPAVEFFLVDARAPGVHVAARAGAAGARVASASPAPERGPHAIRGVARALARDGRRVAPRRRRGVRRARAPREDVPHAGVDTTRRGALRAERRTPLRARGPGGRRAGRLLRGDRLASAAAARARPAHRVVLAGRPAAKGTAPPQGWAGYSGTSRRRRSARPCSSSFA